MSDSLKTTPPPATVTRREREKQQRRAAILAAAERVFARHGFHGASIDRIAEEAQYAVGTLYLYFKDKDALYSALFTSKLGEMVDQVEQAATSGGDPLECLHNAIRAQFDFNESNREFFELIQHHRPADQEAQREEWNAVHETIQRHHQILIRLIERGQRKKLLRPGNSQTYALALVGSIIHLSHEMELGGTRSSNPADFVFDLFIQGAQRPA